MVGRRFYDAMYRRGAPWEVGPRSELVGLVEAGRLSPAALPTAIDLGCGSGANTVFLAEHGFRATGVDFSRVALEKARGKARAAGVDVRFVPGDLLAPAIPGAEGPFDLLVDYGTLDDFRGSKRVAMAGTIHRLSAPGSVVLLWCFYGARRELPVMSFSGPSKMFPGIIPGEEQELFGDAFDIERLAEPPAGSRFACFLLTRR